MELQIQDLISSIKKDGIESANQEAAAIISDAKAKAAEIVADARKEAQQITDKAQQDADLYRSNAVLGAQQAKRDAALAFSREIQAKYEEILSVKVKESLKEDALITLIKAALQDEDASLYAVEVNEVSDSLKQGLADKINDGLEIRPSKKVAYGFRLATKDGSGYFDCTEEEITEMLMPFFRDIHI